jgi:hypothetical protein
LIKARHVILTILTLEVVDMHANEELSKEQGRYILSNDIEAEER